MPVPTLYSLFDSPPGIAHLCGHPCSYIPSRLDFAKERFGGPFTTEQVENVKTFFRILLVLFAIGPVFALKVPASYFIPPPCLACTSTIILYTGKNIVVD